ncbi:sulfatase family protein [Billgrantia aerodenitrificans]|uniref:Sulfatase-like hydrolase/transferase n=1 Tax=Billgrantia aerodenitrificans TaxID=2733483 RepID=A0ABS9AQT8_9GAMM|nr:sulfatase-like hydrolase/transferase [Halomonas aerodenitrificans]MCE8023920.1 sulfatase-like hydrolase/transferase [Halomonas aerodenitrificans]
MRRPNFVLFITDQQRADHLGCYGNPTLRTPHLDALSSRGVHFTRFHVATPICQPNRAALVTGQMPSVNGVRQNGIPLGLDSLTFAEVLRQAGYRTGYVGKAHFQNVTDIPAPPRTLGGVGEAPPAETTLARRHQREGPDYGWEVRRRWVEQPGLSLPTPYYGFEHVRLCIGHGDLVDGHYTAWLRERHPDPASLRGPANALPSSVTAPQCWRTAVPEALYPTTYVKVQACDFLAAQDAQTPFVLVVSFPDPHHPFTPPGRYWSLYDPDEVELPNSFHHPVKAIRGIPAPALEAYRWGSEDPESHWPFAVSERQAREIIALNYGSISMVDDAVGEVLAALAAQGLADDTVVAFTSDHGDYMGDHGYMLKMGLHFQSVLRVPLIWHDPQDAKRRGVSTRLGSAIDLAPTLLQRAGLRVPIGMQGQDLFGTMPAADVLVEDPGIQVFRDSEACSSIVSLVTERWRLSLFEGHEGGELYDLETDPDELDNRWDDPVCRETRLELQHRLGQRLVALRDRSLVATARA